MKRSQWPVNGHNCIAVFPAEGRSTHHALCDSADAPYVLGMGRHEHMSEYLLSQMTDAGSEASSSTHKVAEASVMLVLQKTSPNPSSISPYFKILSSFTLPSSS